jgi:hypothetical protein
MRGQRWQDPKIEIRSDVKRPFYFIRPFVPVVTPDGIIRKQKSIPLGFCDEMSMTKAKARKQEIMATVNAGKFMVQSQIPFSEIVKRFLEARVPQLGAATQAKYRLQIENHIKPAFGKLRMCDIDQPMMETWLNQKERDGLSWWTRQDLRNILSAIFTKAEAWKIWPANQNPCVGVSVWPEERTQGKADPQGRTIAAVPCSDFRYGYLPRCACALNSIDCGGCRHAGVRGSCTRTTRHRQTQANNQHPAPLVSRRYSRAKV